jgi:hypothetical protein
MINAAGVTGGISTHRRFHFFLADRGAGVARLKPPFVAILPTAMSAMMHIIKICV